jgi:hypothetical protein
MAIQEQVIPINFGMGVDTKSDPKLVVAGKMLRLENAVFTHIKRVEKRNGYAALNPAVANFGVLTNPKMVKSYKNQLVAADQNILASYSESQSAWIEEGNYTSTALTVNTIDQEHPVSGYVDCAVLGNYALYGWSTVAQNNVAEPIVHSITFGSVVDLQTGNVLYQEEVSLSSASFINSVRCVLLGGTNLALVYFNSAGTNIVLRLV